MNDLAERALHGAAIGYRAVAGRPMRSFGVAGLLVGSVVVAAGGQVAALGSGRPLTSWLGIASTHAVSARDAVPGAVLFAATAALVGLWLWFVGSVRRRRPPLRRVWAVAGAWALPFVVGPPFMDTGVDSYVAFGRLARLGHDPYRSSPIDLGSSPVVAALDPAARLDPSSAGPMGTLLQHLAVSVAGGSLLGAVLVWRVVGVLAAFAIGRSAVRLAPSPRGAALALCLPNPLVLLYVVSSPHLEAVTVALLLSAVVAARRRRWPGAVLLAALAATLTTVAVVALLMLVAVHVVGARAGRVRAAAQDVAISAATVAVTRLLVPDGFGWTRTVRAQFDQHTPFAVADAVGRLIAPVVRGASYDDLSAGGRVTAVVAAGAVVAYLVATCRARSPEANIGFALLAFALLAPVLHPWYLVWGVLVFAPTATGARRTWVLALSAAGCLLTPPGFTTTTSYALGGAGLGLVTVVTAAVLVRQDRRVRATDAGLGSAAAGDLADRRPDVGEVDARDDDRHEREDPEHGRR